MPRKMKTRNLLIVVAVTAFLSALVGGAISYEFFRLHPSEVLRAQSIEIEDSNGQVRGRLGSEKDGGVFLRFVTPEQKTVLSLGEQGRGSDSDAESALTPIIQMNAKDGRRAVTMTTSNESNGVLAFDSEKRWNTLVLGYYPIDEMSLSGKNLFAWGLAVKRDYGQTGIGIIDKAGPPAIYVAPQPSSK
jgi:hypothetical protein